MVLYTLHTSLCSQCQSPLSEGPGAHRGLEPCRGQRGPREGDGTGPQSGGRVQEGAGRLGEHGEGEGRAGPRSVKEHVLVTFKYLLLSERYM